jgi:sulfate adenylyltransferase subunit 2
LKSHVLSHLRNLEAESIFIFREVAAEMSRPCLLFSGGKDSTVMLALARKAFAPARIPFPIMHVDTGLNFKEVIDYRDKWVEDLGLQLIVASVPDAIERGLVHEEPGGSRNRVFSFRDEFGQWDPKNQRPELWNLYNGRVQQGQSIRVFPLSNWTELDIWTYIAEDNVEVAPLYLAEERDVVERDGMLFAVNEFTPLKEGETAQRKKVRYRTIGDANLTAAVESDADTMEAVLAEVAAARITERGATRGDDKVSETSMEDRKREGYF